MPVLVNSPSPEDELKYCSTYEWEIALHLLELSSGPTKEALVLFVCPQQIFHAAEEGLQIGKKLKRRREDFKLE